MTEPRPVRPTPVALFLIALLVVAGLVLVKKQRWHSPRSVQPPATCPSEVGPASEPVAAGLLGGDQVVRVLLRSSRRALEPVAEGYPGTVEVVQHAGRYLRICRVDLETYVAHVVTGELPDGWDLQTKAAQAVAARSYTMTEMAPDQPYDIRASALAQSFRAETTDLGALEATELTRGQVLIQDGKVVRAFYHSTCGGRTSTAREFWEMVFPRLASVRCDHCHESPLYRWYYVVERQALAERLGIELQSLVVDRIDSTGRVLGVALISGAGIEWMSGEAFRAAVGYTNLRSTHFTIEADGPLLRFDGRGSGHGVGMCQWGARGLSEQGYTWREILGYYYPETDVEAM